MGFTAVRGLDPGWMLRSARAFQHLFSDVSLPWWEYFNAGVVVLGGKQCRPLRAFLEYTAMHWPELEAVMLSGNFGTDQTPLNFMLRREKEPVHFLPRPFNLLNCFPMDSELDSIEHSPSPDFAQFAEKAFRQAMVVDVHRSGICLALFQHCCRAIDRYARGLAPRPRQLPGRQRLLHMSACNLRTQVCTTKAVAIARTAGNKNRRGISLHVGWP